jgi:hypothetical protein
LTLELALRALADRLGLAPAFRRPRLLLVASLLSLVLWSTIAWGLSWLVGQVVHS